MSWGYWHNLGLKNHTRKMGNIHKDFQLNQFMRNILYQNVPIFKLYILLTRRINNCVLRVLKNFGLEALVQFEPKEINK